MSHKTGEGSRNEASACFNLQCIQYEVITTQESTDEVS